MNRLSLLLAAALVLLLGSVAFGEYYEYTDKDGTVRFTDDPSVIPKDQQPEVKTYESIKSEAPPPEMTTEGSEESAPEAAAGNPATEKETTAASPAADTSKTSEGWKKLNELNARRDELRQTFDSLETEKKALGSPPDQSATAIERKEYNDKVMDLNRKIDTYHQRNKEFEADLKAYNSQMGK
ncbi:MAG: DUF4124 domain-containing protein [Desulfobacteraceae bacterium]|nr:DUF4124 domain-containing protein [Desulfobacteraceae bacterium]